VDEVGAVLDRPLHVEHGGQDVVVDVDQVGRVTGLARRPGHDDRDRLTGERDVVDRQGRVARGLHVRRDRPGGGQGALLGVEVGTGEDRDDVARGLGGGGVDAGDAGVGVGAAHEGEVEHARQHHVVGPPGATGDQPLVLLAAARPADLRLGTVVDGGHCAAPAVAADFTAATMFW
jgi:hypothetical protein